nr:MAG TPA: putative carnitine operon oxidoreductase [Caudoviricetes sp.]
MNNRLSVYLNGNLVKSYNAIHGKNKHLDDMTVTYVDEKGNIKNLAGNLSTPAGVYFTTRGGDYHGAPSFLRRTKE